MTTKTSVIAAPTRKFGERKAARHRLSTGRTMAMSLIIVPASIYALCRAPLRNSLYVLMFLALVLPNPQEGLLFYAMICNNKVKPEYDWDEVARITGLKNCDSARVSVFLSISHLLPSISYLLPSSLICSPSLICYSSSLIHYSLSPICFLIQATHDAVIFLTSISPPLMYTP